MNILQFAYPDTANEHLFGSFQFSTAANKATMNTDVQAFARAYIFISLG